MDWYDPCIYLPYDFLTIPINTLPRWLHHYSYIRSLINIGTLGEGHVDLTYEYKYNGSNYYDTKLTRSLFGEESFEQSSSIQSHFPLTKVNFINLYGCSYSPKNNLSENCKIDFYNFHGLLQFLIKVVLKIFLSNVKYKI